MSVKNKQRGVTLVELLVALALTISLSAIVIEIVGKNNESYQASAQAAKLQNHTIFIKNTLTNKIHEADNYGTCPISGSFINVLNSTPFIYDVTKYVQGYEATSSTTWSPAITGTGLTLGTTAGDYVRGNTDILLIRKSDLTIPVLQYPNMEIGVGQQYNNANKQIKVSLSLPSSTIATNDVVLIADQNDRCALFQVTGYNSGTGLVDHSSAAGPNPGNRTLVMARGNVGFPESSTIFQLQQTIFFIGTDSQGNPALREKVDNSSSTVLARNVNDMHILYGEDTNDDGSVNRWLPANQVNMQKVIGVRIFLLLRSTETMNTQNYPYTYMGMTTTPTDRHLYRPLTLTIAFAKNIFSG